MARFSVRHDRDGTMCWWLTGHGKELQVRAIHELMTELSRYRQSLGTTALPSPNAVRHLPAHGKGVLALQRIAAGERVFAVH